MPRFLPTAWHWAKPPVSERKETVHVELNQVAGPGSGSPELASRDTAPEAALREFASMPIELVVQQLDSGLKGLTFTAAADRLARNGPNLLSTKKPPTWWMLLLTILPNPFNILLGLLAIISVATPSPSWSTFILLIVMVVISCIVRFWQEYQSTTAAIKLQAGVSTNVRVRRQNGYGLSEDLVVDEKTLVLGDILLVDPGDSIPADCLVLEASNLRISQSSLSGESAAQRKIGSLQGEKKASSLLELENILFMGTSVISGSGVALVLRTGDDAFIATIVKQLNKKRPLNSFQKGIRQVTYMMMAFMFVMVPLVLTISGKITGNWSQAALFSVSVAVGLVPEMLPAIVNANLARGAFLMAKKKAIVKRLDAIQNLGGMTVLCSDKTGTLTKDEVHLCHYVDPSGNENKRVAQLAFTNAFNQSGKKNSIDSAILKHGSVDEKDDFIVRCEKVGEIPFNFETRRSSCIMMTPAKKLLLVCKGAFEEVSSLCTSLRHEGKVVPLDAARYNALSNQSAAFNDDGYRVLIVATRELCQSDMESEDGTLPEDLDSKMTVEGLLTFLDPPKDDAAISIQRLQELGVDVRILTGDNLGVALKICRSLNLVREFEEEGLQAITGPDLARIGDADEFNRTVKNCKIFAKLTPSQKGEVVMSLRNAGEVVGMLGDGINDCVALRFADAGISVDSGASVAKDCADIILTEKELAIVADGVVTGRITHGNTIKYIKMVASSNFGNVFSILVASSWLPFNPMSALQILIQNLLYDISQIAIPWDRLDPEYVAIPQRWDAPDLFRFIVVLGPTSSTIDMCTFTLNWFYYGIKTTDSSFGGSRPGHGVAVFQTHWFLEGLLTQTMIVHLLRTAKIPFFRSRATMPLVVSTTAMMGVGLALPYIPHLRDALGMATPSPTFIGFLAAELVLYCVEVQLVKMAYIRLFGRWL